MSHTLVQLCSLSLEAPLEPVEALSPPEISLHLIPDGCLDEAMRVAFEALSGRLLEFGHWASLLSRLVEGGGLPDVLYRRVWAAMFLASTGILSPFGLPLSSEGVLPKTLLWGRDGYMRIDDIYLSPEQWPGLGGILSPQDLGPRYAALRAGMSTLDAGALPEPAMITHLQPISVVVNMEEEGVWR